MKKTLLYVMAVSLFIVGCTSKEQDEQINSFWRQQFAAFFAQRLGPRPTGDPNMTPERLLLDKDGKPLFPQEETIQDQNAQGPASISQSTDQSSANKQPSTGTSANNSATPTANTSKATPIKAVLFTHSDSPKCKQLKADNWSEKFQQKYVGSITLTEYDMKNPDSKAPLQELMNKHKLASITVPILFVGDQVLQGYPFAQEDQEVQKALATAAQTKQLAAQKKRKQPSNQYMEIIMEDSAKTPKKNTRASAKDTQAIQNALATVVKNNQATLNDMGSIFGEDTKAQAYAIISRTESLLRKKALSSPDYKTYLATQKSLLQTQEKELNALMRQNANRLSSIRS